MFSNMQKTVFLYYHINVVIMSIMKKNFVLVPYNCSILGGLKPSIVDFEYFFYVGQYYVIIFLRIWVNIIFLSWEVGGTHICYKN